MVALKGGGTHEKKTHISQISHLQTLAHYIMSDEIWNHTLVVVDIDSNIIKILWPNLFPPPPKKKDNF